MLHTTARAMRPATTRLARRAFAASPKPTNAMRGPIGWGALAVTGAAGCGLAYYYEVEKTRRQEQAAKKQTTYGKPSLGGPWTLVDAKTNKPVTDASFHGSYVLLYFGFSRCPDICPSELLKVQKVLRLLGDEAPTPLFVSLDPRRDSLRQLRVYAKDFDERIRFLVGICA
jgi:protein SCO1/2